MTGAQTRAVVAVKVLVEQHQVAEVRIVLELLGSAVDRPMTVRVAKEDAGEPAGDFFRDLIETQLFGAVMPRERFPKTT